MGETLYIMGAGGHATVVADSADLSDFSSVTFVDDNPDLIGTELLNISINGPIETVLKEKTAKLHLAIGNNQTRSELKEKFKQHEFATLLSSKAVISQHAMINAGAFIAPLAVIAVNVIIGESTIVNHQAIVDHDCVIGDSCHIAPNATLGGNVTIGDRVMIGANATILPGVSIASDVVVGAGAVVTKDIRSPQTVVGVPARSLHE